MDDSAHERVYDAVPFDELEYDEDEELYTYQCPCGDLFEISQAELDAGERIAKCPSCSLRLRVVLPGEEDNDTQPEAMSAAQKKAAAEEALEEAEFAALDKKLESKLGLSSASDNASVPASTAAAAAAAAPAPGVADSCAVASDDPPTRQIASPA
jgi:diphthamide biosynthesis protein 3